MDQHIKQGKTPTRISKEIGCCHQAVRFALARFGIRPIPNARPRPPIKYPELHDREWLAAKLETMSQKQIAELLGCTDAMVFNYRTKFGLEIKIKHTSLHKQAA